MFASNALAARIEHAEARLTESILKAVIASGSAARPLLERIGRGVAAYAGPSSPMNKMIGAGFDALPSSTRLDEIEAQFAERGAPLQAEVSTLADPAFSSMLTGRGYALHNFENVSGRPVVDTDRNLADTDVRIDLMKAAGAEEWIDAAITGFQHPDGKGVPPSELPPREIFETALRPWVRVEGFHRYCAWLDGKLAGIATLRIDDGIAQLCGAATLPSFRRRGVQAALLRRRLADSAAVDCKIAVVTTQPGSTSQENVHRQGFALLYARAILVKP